LTLIAETEDELAGILTIASSFREVPFLQEVAKREREIIARKIIF
jgi:hypothetical protein